jgi:hypothetical protein
MEGLNNTTGFVGRFDCLSSDNRKCTLDSTVSYGTAIHSYSSTAVAPTLYLDSVNSRYTQLSTAGPATIYTRTFTITQFTGYETATVTISWEDHGAHSIVLSENFYDWL